MMTSITKFGYRKENISPSKLPRFLAFTNLSNHVGGSEQTLRKAELLRNSINF